MRRREPTPQSFERTVRAFTFEVALSLQSRGAPNRFVSTIRDFPAGESGWHVPPADLHVIDGNPLEDINLLADANRNLA
jgi:hypothetical protein